MKEGMSLKETFIAAVLALGLCCVVARCNETANPPSKGADFLTKQGYSEVQGGEIPSYFNGCGKNIMSRVYTARSSTGETVQKTVCFGPVGLYEPLFGG